MSLVGRVNSGFVPELGSKYKSQVDEAFEFKKKKRFLVFHRMAGARRAKLYRTVIQFSFRDL